MKLTESTEIIKGYKKTKLGWIPEEWEIIKLGEVGEFKNGINKDKEDFGFGVPFINLMDVFGKPVLIQDDWDLVNANQNEIENYSLKKGDVLFIRSSVKPSGVGLTSIVKEDIHNTVYSGFLIRYRPNIESPFDIDYLQYGFYERGFRKRLIVRSSTSANTNINQDNLKQLLISLPPFPEQQKIATILSTWDRAIAKQEQLIAAKQEYKKGLMQLLLTGKKRFDGFEEEWEEVKLGDIGQVQTGNTPSKKEPDLWEGEFYWTTADDMGEKYINDTNQKLTLKGKSKARIAKRGSVLVTCIASIGKNSITNVDTGFNQQINAISTNDYYDNEFAYYLIDFNPIKLLQFAGAGAMPMLNKNTFMSIKFCFPKLEEQQKIASVLSAADKEIELLQNELMQLQGQKRGLMQRLLTGEVRVKV